MGGCQNWSRRSGTRNLDQIWTKSGPNLDTILTGFSKMAAEIPGKILCPRTRELSLASASSEKFKLCLYRDCVRTREEVTKKIPFVCTFTYEQRNEPIGPFLSCFMCIYIHRKMRSGPVQNGLDQSRIWTACPDMPSRFFDLDRGVPRSGPVVDQIWTKSGPNLESSKNRPDQFWQPPTMSGTFYVQGIFMY